MAHAHDASENNPVKETLHSLIGIVLLLVIIGGIAVFAWLRPAGNHEPATVSATPAGRALDELAQKQDAPASAEQAKPATTAEASADTTAKDGAEATAQAEQSAEKPAQ